MSLERTLSFELVLVDKGNLKGKARRGMVLFDEITTPQSIDTPSGGPPPPFGLGWLAPARVAKHEIGRPACITSVGRGM